MKSGIDGDSRSFRFIIMTTNFIIRFDPVGRYYRFKFSVGPMILHLGWNKGNGCQNFLVRAVYLRLFRTK